MNYIEKHIATIKAMYKPDNRYKVFYLASSSDGSGTIISAILQYRGHKYYFYRDKLEG